MIWGISVPPWLLISPHIFLLTNLNPEFKEIRQASFLTWSFICNIRISLYIFFQLISNCNLIFSLINGHNFIYPVVFLKMVLHYLWKRWWLYFQLYSFTKFFSSYDYKGLSLHSSTHFLLLLDIMSLVNVPMMFSY